MARRPFNLQLAGPDWEPLYAYAESQGITPGQAARELLMASLATTPKDSVYLAAARNARAEIARIAYAAAGRAMQSAWQEMQARAMALGVPLEDADG